MDDVGTSTSAPVTREAVGGNMTRVTNINTESDIGKGLVKEI